MGAEAPPAAVKLNLAPEGWRKQRLALVRRAQWRRAFALGGRGLCGGFSPLRPLRCHHPLARSATSRKRSARRAQGRFHQTRRKRNGRRSRPRSIRIITRSKSCFHLFQSLPKPDVRITVYDQTARNISVQGRGALRGARLSVCGEGEKESRLCGPSLSIRARRGFCLTVTRNFAWKENRNDCPPGSRE